MKLEFNLKKREATLEADVERLVEKGLDNKSKKPEKKTRYQIRQEEKRKNEELKHKQQMQNTVLALIGLGVLIAFAVIASVMGWE